MAVHVIPFQMPEPTAIPEHIAGALRSLPAAAAVRRGLELLMQIEVADVMVLERIVDGRLQLAEVLCREGSAEGLKQDLAQESFYGQPPAADSGLAGRAIAQGQPLLLLGQVGAGEESPLPAVLDRHLQARGDGNIGFLYVLTLANGGAPVGVLTLIRAAAEGPLNHEQPNITEAMRRLLAEVLSAT